MISDADGDGEWSKSKLSSGNFQGKVERWFGDIPSVMQVYQLRKTVISYRELEAGSQSAPPPRPCSSTRSLDSSSTRRPTTARGPYSVLLIGKFRFEISPTWLAGCPSVGPAAPSALSAEGDTASDWTGFTLILKLRVGIR